MELTLTFHTKARVELTEAKFVRSGHPPFHSVRGKSGDAAVGCFQWTAAVRAFSQLAVGSRLAAVEGAPPYKLVGEKSSPAASLDYAISKPTQWIVDLFGTGSEEKPFALRVFERHNTEQKLPGPVSIQLSPSLRESDAVRVRLDGRELNESRELRELLAKLQGRELPAAPALIVPESWYREEWFARQLEEEIATTLRDVTLMEPLAFESIERRLRRFPWACESEAIPRVIQGLRQALSSSRARYRNPDRAALAGLRSGPIKVSALPFAVGAFALFELLKIEEGIPFELDWEHGASGEITGFAGVGASAVSWGAVSRQTLGGSTPLMLLPRTTFELVLPAQLERREVREVFLAEDPRGYPRQLLDLASSIDGFFESPPSPREATLAELPTRLSHGEGAVICAFPLSRIDARILDARIEPLPAELGKVGDNVLLGHGLDPAQADLLCSALRSAWFRLLESAEARSAVTGSLLSDSRYVAFLKRLGGLYMV